MARTVGLLGNPLHWHWYCLGKNLGIKDLLQALTCHSLSQAYWIDFGFSFIEGPASWRTPIAIQLVFAIAVVFIVWGLPESPRWLAKRGRMEEALEVICAVIDLPEDDPYVISEMESIRQVLALEQNEKAQNWTSVFKKDILQTRKRVGLAWFGLFMNQLSGINLGTYEEFAVSTSLSGVVNKTIAANACHQSSTTYPLPWETLSICLALPHC